MIVYNIYFILVILLALIISCARKKFWLSTDNRIIIDNKLNVDMLCKMVFCIIAFGYLIFLASQRYDVGFDYFQYTLAYEGISDSKSLTEAFRVSRKYEFGYIIFEYIFSRIAPGYKAFLLIHALIVVGMFALIVLINSKSVYISAAIYMLFNLYAIDLNFSRQAIAMAIAFAGFELIRKRHIFVYIATILLAMTFHYSAAIMFIFVALYFIRPKKIIYLCIFVLGGLLLLISDKIVELVCVFFEKYKVYIDTAYLIKDGTTIGTVTFMLLGIIIVFAYFFTDWKKHSKNADNYVKLAFICVLLSMFMKKHYILDRANYYYIVFFALSLPDLIHYLSKSAWKKAVDEFASSAKKTDIIKSAAGLRIIASFAAIGVITFSSAAYFEYSVNDGSHRVYPYKTADERLLSLSNMGQSELKRLQTTTSLYEYISLWNNEDYVVIASYDYDVFAYLQYNDITMDVLANQIQAMNAQPVFDKLSHCAVNKGVFVIDSGKLIEEVSDSYIKTNIDNNVFAGQSIGSEKWIIVNDTEYIGQSRSMDVVVFSKSRNKVVDYCQILQGDVHAVPTLYHNDMDRYVPKILNHQSTYKDILLYMLDEKNTIIAYNNNEDYEGQELSKWYDRYYRMAGSTITTDALCKQNVAAMRFGGEWREIMYPSSPAQIEANIDGVFYDVYADSYNSYCKINGVKVSSAGTGLNVIIISPEGEILFNGSVDVYSNFNEVTVNDYALEGV